MRRDLRPASEGLFGARATSVETWEPVQFTRSGDTISRVDFGGKSFVREAKQALPKA